MGVLVQPLRLERDFTDRHMHDPGFLDLVFNPSFPDLGDGLGNLKRHGAGLGVGHQPARAQHLAEFAHCPHQVRS